MQVKALTCKVKSHVNIYSRNVVIYGIRFIYNGLRQSRKPFYSQMTWHFCFLKTNLVFSTLERDRLAYQHFTSESPANFSKTILNWVLQLCGVTVQECRSWTGLPADQIFHHLKIFFTFCDEKHNNEDQDWGARSVWQKWSNILLPKVQQLVSWVFSHVIKVGIPNGGKCF